MTYVRFEKGNLDTDTHTHAHVEHHVKVKAEIRVVMLQARKYHRLPANHRNTEERHGTDFSSQPSEHLPLSQHLDLRRLASRAVRRQIANSPVGGTLRWQP